MSEGLKNGLHTIVERVSERQLRLSFAILVSIFAHLFILLLYFVQPDGKLTKPVDTGLEVILVNTTNHKRPNKAEVYAQVDLEGGGMHEKGRSQSPLPDSGKILEGDSLEAMQKRIAEFEAQQRELLSQVKNNPKFKLPNEKQKRDDHKSDDGSKDDEKRNALARAAAEIAQTIEDQNKRPRKTYITPSTQKVGYAQYYKSMQKKIEEVGTLNFPKHDGKKLYGELLVYIPIFQDGSIYEKEGGPKIERSSGNPKLDEAALRIIRQAAPFGHFPPKMRSTDKDDLWVVVTRFKFTREQLLEAELRGGQ